MGKLTSVAIEAILCGAIALFILGGLIFAICKREKEWLVYILAPILILIFTGLALFMLHTYNEPTVVTYTGVYLGEHDSRWEEPREYFWSGEGNKVVLYGANDLLDELHNEQLAVGRLYTIRYEKHSNVPVDIHPVRDTQSTGTPLIDEPSDVP